MRVGLFSLLHALLLAAGIATTADALQLTTDERLSYWYLDIYRPFFKPRSLPDGRVSMESQRPHSRAAAFLATKPEDTFRVFVLGGSVAYLFDSNPTLAEGWTFAKILSLALAGRKVEVIHCGMAAYDSYRESLIFDEVLGYAPDLIVLMSGHNEVSEMAGAPPRLLRPVLAARRLLGLDAPLRKRLASIFVPRANFAREFESNLSRMAEAARKRGVPLVLCSLPRHVGMPPSASLPDDAEFLSAWRGWLAGDLPGAEASLRAQSPQSSLTLAFNRILLGRILERQGRIAAARTAYEDAIEARGALGAPMNRIVRAVSSKYAAQVADLEHVLGPGPKEARNDHLIYDEMHWNRFADPRVSVELARAAARAAPGQGWKAAALETVPQSRTPTHAEALEICERRFDQAFWTAFDSQSVMTGFNEQVLYLFELLARDNPQWLEKELHDARRHQDSLRQNMWVTATEPLLTKSRALGMMHAAEALRRLGRTQRAVYWLARARDIDPSLTAARRAPPRPPSPRPTAPKTRAQNDIENGRGSVTIEEALAFYPGFLEGCANRRFMVAAFTAFAAGRWDKGFPAIRQACAGSWFQTQAALARFCQDKPKTCVPWRLAEDELKRRQDEAIDAYGAGRRAEAVRLLNGILALVPDEPNSLLSLASDAAVSDDNSRALELYGRASALNGAPSFYRVELLSGRAAAYERLGRTREAADDIVEALKIAPPNWPRRPEASATALRLKAPL